MSDMKAVEIEMFTDALRVETERTDWLSSAMVYSEKPPQRLPVTDWAMLRTELAQDRDEG